LLVFLICRADRLAAPRAGKSSEISRAMMESTTSSSMSVKPRRIDVSFELSRPGEWEQICGAVATCLPGKR
jgi:hypothetical protein